MEWFRNILSKVREDDESPLAVDGIPAAPMTAEPDDAELAAQALLDVLAEVGDKPAAKPAPGVNTVEYYRMLKVKMRKARAASVQRACRFLACCEQELAKPSLPMTGPRSLALLEAELYKRIDVVEQEGGELKRRWQHCLAEVTVRMYDGIGKDDGLA